MIFQYIFTILCNFEITIGTSIWQRSSLCVLLCVRQCGINDSWWTSFSNFRLTRSNHRACRCHTRSVGKCNEGTKESELSLRQRLFMISFHVQSTVTLANPVILILWEIILSNQERKWSCRWRSISIAGKRYWKTSSVMAYNIGTLLYILSLYSIFVKDRITYKKTKNTSHFLSHIISCRKRILANVTLVIRYYADCSSAV
jgi:hypothetical protein